jgi:glycerol-3-phosphate dehydrogenase
MPRGPWVGTLLQRLQHTADAPVRLVKGSHIIVPRLFEHERAYILQNDDGRIVFAIPYERDFTLIGTTDLDYGGDPGDVAITAVETDYLCAAVNRYFSAPVSPADVVGSYRGAAAVRRWGVRGQGGDPRLCAGLDDEAPGRAAAQHLWRQDHHLSAPGRGDLTEAEVAWLMDKEWAREAADVLWRRSKLGLRLSEAEATALGDWMAERRREMGKAA